MQKNTYRPKYLAAANIAQMRWCESKFVFRSRRDEEMFRLAYEEDCKKYGEGLSVKQLNKLLRSEKSGPDQKKKIVNLSDGGLLVFYSDEGVDILPDEIERVKAEVQASGKLPEEGSYIYGLGLLIPSPNSSAYSIGEAHQLALAKNLPSLRYHFRFRDYIIEAVPDGIATDYCYEFKSTATGFLFRYAKPVAIAQAMLYSYFFNRKKYKVEIYIRDKGEKKTIDGELNRAEVEGMLDRMDALFKQTVEPIPPKRFKCRNCEFLKDCSIS